MSLFITSRRHPQWGAAQRPLRSCGVGTCVACRSVWCEQMPQIFWHDKYVYWGWLRIPIHIYRFGHSCFCVCSTHLRRADGQRHYHCMSVPCMIDVYAIEAPLHISPCRCARRCVKVKTGRRKSRSKFHRHRMSAAADEEKGKYDRMFVRETSPSG